MCLVGEGKAIVPVYLLAVLSILCHAYQRLLEDYGHQNHWGSSENTLQRIEAELRQYLTPKEQKRTDNPYCKPVDGHKANSHDMRVLIQGRIGSIIFFAILGHCAPFSCEELTED
jgi:hypothetical protein